MLQRQPTRPDPWDTRGWRRGSSSAGGEGEPLPRFGLNEERDEPWDRPRSGTHSLIPTAMDMDEEEVRTVSPWTRRRRAVGLFLAIFAPVVLLALYEAASLSRGAAARAGLADLDRLLASPALDNGLMAGRAEARLRIHDPQPALTEDEARDAAQMALEQTVGLAQVACADVDMPPARLWVVANVTEDGAVASIAVEGATHGQPQLASCVGGIVQHMHVPAFRGPPVTVAREVVLR